MVNTIKKSLDIKKKKELVKQLDNEEEFSKWAVKLVRAGRISK